MAFLYSAYGLHLRVNLPIPCWTELVTSPVVDVQVWLREQPLWLSELQETKHEIFYSSPYRDEFGKPSITVWKLGDSAYFRILYHDGTEFFVDQAGTRIWGTWPEPLALEDTAVFLRGPIMGFVLRLRGLTSLHASAVAVDNQGIALVGQAGAGKSTTAAALGRLGYPIISDDIAPLLDRGDSILVQSGYPCLCLWPEAVNSLYGSPDALPLLTPNWTKRFLALDKNGCRFQQKPLPLAAIYILRERQEAPKGPTVESISAGSGLFALVCNTYMNYLPDPGIRAREFELLGRVAASVPVRQVRSHAELTTLTTLCDVILNDFHSLAAATFPIREARPA